MKWQQKKKYSSFLRRAETYIFPAKILPQNYAAKQTVRIATMAAVAMCESIEAVSDEKAEIKWVNDICVRDK